MMFDMKGVETNCAQAAGDSTVNLPANKSNSGMRWFAGKSHSQRA